MVKDNFTIEVKYSDEAIKKKLVKFIVTEGNEFVLTADELISMLVHQVNSETLSPTFVEMDRINVVEVGRQIRCKLDRDFKKGSIININYAHPYPLEFAIIEEAFKIAKIEKTSKVTELTKEFLDDVKKRITPKMVDFTKKFYKSINSVNLKNKTMEDTNVVLAKYKVLGEIIPTNEVGDPQPALEIDSIQEVPTVVGEGWVADGLAERVEEVAPAVEAEAASEVAPEAEPVAEEKVEGSETV